MCRPILDYVCGGKYEIEILYVVCMYVFGLEFRKCSGLVFCGLKQNRSNQYWCFTTLPL